MLIRGKSDFGKGDIPREGRHPLAACCALHGRRALAACAESLLATIQARCSIKRMVGWKPGCCSTRARPGILAHNDGGEVSYRQPGMAIFSQWTELQR